MDLGEMGEIKRNAGNGRRKEAANISKMRFGYTPPTRRLAAWGCPGYVSPSLNHSKNQQENQKPMFMS